MLADTVVYSVDGESYCWRDVILSAVRRGEWSAVERRARLGAACVRHAEATGMSLPSSAVDAASREFRYARDLVTAQSMEDWLASREIQVQEWSAYLRRDLERARNTADPASLLGRYPVTDADATRLALIDAICGSELDAWAHALARESAAHAALATVPAERDDHAHADDPSSAHAVPSTVVGGDETLVRASVRRLAAIEESMREFRAATLTDKAVQDYVNGRQLDWVRFDCRLLAFPREEMAAEAALLLREDGEGFTGVYMVARTAPRVARFFLDQVDESLRDHFLGSRAGDLIGPVRIGAEYVLYEVEAKVLPSIHDDEVRTRAEQAVLALVMEQQVTRRVAWTRRG